MRISASSLLGIGLLVFGMVVIGVRLAGVASVLAFADGRLTQLNGALCFALLGAALAAECVVQENALRRIRAGVAAAVALIGGLIVFEHILGLDLGIDLPDFHQSAADGAAYPGRVALPTAFAFVLAAAAIFQMDRVRGIPGGLVVQGSTIAIFLIGLVGFGGRAIRLPLMYPESAFASMAFLTAVGLIVVSAALWLAWRRMSWYGSRSLARSEEQRIVLAGTAVLTLIVCAAVLSGFSVMASQLEVTARAGLVDLVKSHIQLFGITIDTRTSRAAMISTRPFVAEQLASLHKDASNAPAVAVLRQEAESMLGFGFSAVSFQGLHGEPRGAAGRPVARPTLSVPVEGLQRTVLMWDDGFVLHTRMTVERGGTPVGVMLAEQRLDALTKAMQEADDFAASAEIAVCKLVAGDMECVRQSPESPVFREPYSRSGPVALALGGLTDARLHRDKRGQQVMVAFGPIGKTGLAMTLKRDTVDLYAPMRRNLWMASLLMLVMIALGAWLLKYYIAPLVRRLAQSEERLALALDGSRLALWDLDARSGRVWLDAHWARMLESGSSPTLCTSQDLMRLVHPDDVAPLRQHLAEVLQGVAVYYDVEHRVKKATGEWRWIHSRGKVVERDDAGRAVRLAGSNADIDLRKQLELRLAHQAGHDALTGLPNRNLFHDRMGSAIARSRRHRSLMAVMYLDIDKFKSVNDTHGHDVGDALIRGFGRRLVDCIRNTDTAARLGGDEFAVILEEVEDTAVGRRVAEKIVAAMREEFVLGERKLCVSTSLGVSFYSGTDEIGAEAIVKQADQALYEAKAAGRDTYRVAA